MLILTRRIDQTIIIGDDIRITIVGMRGAQVRVGIDAPSHISVHREEIYNLLKQNSSGLTNEENAGLTIWSVGRDQIGD